MKLIYEVANNLFGRKYTVIVYTEKDKAEMTSKKNEAAYSVLRDNCPELAPYPLGFLCIRAFKSTKRSERYKSLCEKFVGDIQEDSLFGKDCTARADKWDAIYQNIKYSDSTIERKMALMTLGQ